MPPKITTSIRLSRVVREALFAMAALEEKSISEAAEELMTAGLRRRRYLSKTVTKVAKPQKE